MARTISLAASMPVRPELLYDMYLDPDRHAAFTGTAVTIDSKPGSAFEAMRVACRLQLSPLRVKTYAAPVPLPNFLLE